MGDQQLVHFKTEQLLESKLVLPGCSLFSPLKLPLFISPGSFCDHPGCVPEQSPSFPPRLRPVPDVDHCPGAHVHLHVHRLSRIELVLVDGQVHFGSQPAQLGDVIRCTPAFPLCEVEGIQSMAGCLEVNHGGAVEDGGEDVLVNLVGSWAREHLHLLLVLFAEHYEVAKWWLLVREDEGWMGFGAEKG